MIRKTILFALPLALVACGKSETASEPSPTPNVSAPSPQDTRLTGAKLVVGANGVGARGAQPLTFGASRAEVDAMAARAFGTKGVQSRNQECGAGPMDFSQYGPLQLGYLDGKLAGWYLKQGDGVVTSDGIRPGISLDALKEERPVQTIQSTLDGEFSYTTGDYGIITGFADNAGTITGLAAGVTCFFR